MNELQKRSLLYGIGSMVLGGLGIAWGVGRASADVMTLLSSADVQLRLAYGIPAKDQQGRPLDAREKMITEAEDYLAQVERVQPGMAVTAEFQGFAAMLRGRWQDAATAYRRARGCGDCGAEQRDILLFNEARMLAQAGSREQAVALFEQNAAALDTRFGHQRSIEQAAVLRELGRRTDAERLLDAVMRDGAAAPMASLQAGQQYERLGHPAKAEAMFTRAAAGVPIADYHLARLKLQLGEVDTSLQLLERAAQALPAEVRRRIREDAEAWQAVAGEARFRELCATPPATPGR
ncbi:MAG: tetratricopeptide repeat protein [Planctomycetes bacterium]|nr:tetratricopeptide repeat protein [Planctomycetota bacterium]